MIIWGYAFAFMYALLCVFAAFILNKLGVGKKYTRKVVHISVGFEWFILYHFMGESFHFLIVCLSCAALLLLEYKMRLVPALSSDEDNAPGTVYYGLAMSIMALVSLFVPRMLLPFGIGVIVTSLGDGMAGVIGQLIKRGNRKIYGNKTIFGTLAIFVFSFIGIFIFAKIYNLPLRIWQVLAIAFFATVLELISTRGLDNITLTLGSAFLSYFLMYFDGSEGYLLPILLTPLIIAVVLTKSVLTKLGVVFAVALDLIVSVAFGNSGFLLLLVFLLLSVVSDKIKGRCRRRDAALRAEERSDMRGAWQVFSNGFAAAASAILFIIFENPIFTLMYVASVAEAFADTVASGLGVFAKNTYDPFRFRKCEKGMSGGMSLIGTLSSLVASTLISCLAFAFGMADIKGVLIVSAIAFSGMILDSLFGSLLQVKYRCSVCGKITERKEHCGAPTEKYRGVSFINNDVVNIASNVFTALLTFVIFSV